MRATRILGTAAIGLALSIVVATVWVAVDAMRQTAAAIGKGLFEGLAQEFEPWSRALACAPADLEVAPGSPGYVESLGPGGVQYHYATKGRTRTLVAIEVQLGKERARWPAATYEGPPSRDIAPDRLTVLELPFSFVRVRVIDDKGNVRGRVGVAWREVRDTLCRGSGTSWGEGEVDLMLGPGTWALGIEGEGEPRHEITLGGGEAVSCTLGPASLVVDRRR